ncbi:MAG: hypothetical protein KGL39_33340 [Patescibacteria group bacterium]|nr:hypothetical protein [Patescibacteria group bacterium]
MPIIGQRALMPKRFEILLDTAGTEDGFVEVWLTVNGHRIENRVFDLADEEFYARLQEWFQSLMMRRC